MSGFTKKFLFLKPGTVFISNNDLVVFLKSSIFNSLLFEKNKYLWLDLVGLQKNKVYFSTVVRDTTSLHKTVFITPTNTSFNTPSNWLFREFNEFFMTVFVQKADNRNLLLDYNTTYKPLLKTFPTTGVEEIFYDVNLGSLVFVNLNNIEL
jgi:hypothetical protein